MRFLLAALLLVPARAPVLVAEGAIQPDLAVDKDGGYHCAFIRNGNIEYSGSTDGGKTWSAPAVAIDGKGRATGGCQRGPRLGVGPKGIVITAPICFDPEEFKNRYPKSELWLTASIDGGKTFAKPLQVNDKPKTAAEALHAMTVDRKGTAHVTWLDCRDGRTQDLYYASWNEKISKPVRIAATLCECCAPGMTVDNLDQPVFVYREGGRKKSRAIMMCRGTAPAVQINKGETKVDG